MDAWWALLLVQTIYIDMSSCSRNKYVYQVPSNCKILSEETSFIYRKIASQSFTKWVHNNTGSQFSNNV